MPFDVFLLAAPISIGIAIFLAVSYSRDRRRARGRRDDGGPW